MFLLFFSRVFYVLFVFLVIFKACGLSIRGLLFFFHFLRLLKQSVGCDGEIGKDSFLGGNGKK